MGNYWNKWKVHLIIYSFDVLADIFAFAKASRKFRESSRIDPCAQLYLSLSIRSPVSIWIVLSELTNTFSKAYFKPTIKATN